MTTSKTFLGLSILAATAGLMTATVPALAEYPERPITWIVPWGAGGGTDATSRMLASLVEQELGVPVNVVNRTGGSGVVGHSAISTASPDGYTMGTITVEIAMMHWAGLTELDYTGYVPLGLYNADPAGLQVAADSPYQNANELVDAIKADPGALKSSGTGQGGIWHLALAGMLNTLGVDPAASPWVPSKGAASGLQDMVSGGVAIVPCSIPEAQSLIDAGKVRSLAVMADERIAALPDLPTLKEQGIDWTLATWRGVAAPAGVSDEVRDKLEAALAAAVASDEFKEFMAGRGFGITYRDAGGFGEWLAYSDKAIGETMEAAGLKK